MKVMFSLIKKFNSRILLISLLFALFLATGCSLNPKPHNTITDFYAGIKTFFPVVVEGTVDVNYQLFSFRKDFVAIVAQDSIEITLIEGGIFGLNAQPFLTFRSDSLTVIDSQFSQIPLFFRESYTPGSLIKTIAENDVKFGRNGLPTEISLKQYDTILKLEYKNRVIKSLEIFQKNKLIANIKIDKITQEINQVEQN